MARHEAADSFLEACPATHDLKEVRVVGAGDTEAHAKIAVPFSRSLLAHRDLW